MKQLLATCVTGLLVVGTADGQIRVFFDFEGVGETEARGAVDPLSYGNPEVDENTPTRLYIYGEFLGANDLWLAINFDVTADGDATLSNPIMYNHRTQNGRRWSSRGNSLNSPTNASFRSAWIGNPAEFPGGMWNWDEAYATAQTGDPFNAADNSDDEHYRRAWDSQNGEFGTTLLGYVDVEGEAGASLWMTIEAPIFARLGGSHLDEIYFGYGDSSMNPVHTGERTLIAEATIIPEPAGLLLLGLGALALRRRHGMRKNRK